MSYDKVNAYGQNQKAIMNESGNSRDTDARALAACAYGLEEAKKLMEQDSKSKECIKNYGDAVRHNQRLWTIFQVALTDPENPLPQELKITLLNLSRYVDKTSFAAVGKYTPELVDSLININRIIAKGLSTPIEAGTTPVSIPAEVRAATPTSLMTSA